MKVTVIKSFEGQAVTSTDYDINSDSDREIVATVIHVALTQGYDIDVQRHDTRGEVSYTKPMPVEYIANDLR